MSNELVINAVFFIFPRFGNYLSPIINLTDFISTRAKLIYLNKDVHRTCWCIYEKPINVFCGICGSFI